MKPMNENKSQKVYEETDAKLMLLKKLTGVSRIRLIDDAVNFLTDHFKKHGTLSVSMKESKRA